VHLPFPGLSLSLGITALGISINQILKGNRFIIEKTLLSDARKKPIVNQSMPEEFSFLHYSNYCSRNDILDRRQLPGHALLPDVMLVSMVHILLDYGRSWFDPILHPYQLYYSPFHDCEQEHDDCSPEVLPHQHDR